MTISGLERWTRFNEAARDLAKRQDKSLASLEDKAGDLRKEFLPGSRLPWRLKDLIRLPDYAWTLFYRRLLEESHNAEVIPSPVADQTDQRWLTQHATCFINVRATGLEPKSCGSFISALKVLPAIRAHNLHLAPYFECVFDNLYAINSVKTIASEIVDPFYLEAGLSPDEQLMLFIDAAHLLKKTVGFDLEPHTGQFSWIVLSHPHCFRWLRLAPNRTSLLDGMTQARMLEEDIQIRLADEVSQIVGKIVKESGATENEAAGVPATELRVRQNRIFDTLSGAGYWTLPSHTWGGAGLPEFKGYNRKKGFPIFSYISLKGENHAKHAFGMLTPYKFYTGLPINRSPRSDTPPQRFPAAIDLFTGTFDEIQARFGYDFLRVDYVDHVFDSVADNDEDFPYSDRLTPTILRETITRVRNRCPYIGAMAERMGHDIDIYSKVGFNLVLGTEVLGNYNQESLSWVMEVSKLIAKTQPIDRPVGSVQLALDTHDSGHPLFWKQPLAQVIGPEGMRLRHFISRFATAGSGFRPKYECLGNQDLSSGLYEANNKAVSLKWGDDQDYLQRYHWLEDIFRRYQDQILKGKIAGFTAQSNHAWWFIELPDQERLLCLVYLERHYPDIKSQLADSTPYPDLRNLKVKVAEGRQSTMTKAMELRWFAPEETPVPIAPDGAIEILRLMHNEFKLFRIVPGP